MDQLSGVFTTLAEYTSREARFNLVLVCLDKLNSEEKTSHVAATRTLADQLYVSQRTIQRWAQGGIQSCNVNAEAIINAALLIDPEKSAQVLSKDLEGHRDQLELMIKVLAPGSVCEPESREEIEDLGPRLSVKQRGELQEDEEEAIKEDPHLRKAILDVIREQGGAKSAEIADILELSSYEAMLAIEGALKAGLIAGGEGPAAAYWFIRLGEQLEEAIPQ